MPLRRVGVRPPPTLGSCTVFHRGLRIDRESGLFICLGRSVCRCCVGGSGRRDRVGRGNASFDVIGEFVLAPPDGPASRSFQTLHIDFGVPLIATRAADVARFAAVHVAADARLTRAWTRLVAFAPLLAERRWPDHDQLIDRFAAYGHTHVPGMALRATPRAASPGSSKPRSAIHPYWPASRPPRGSVVVWSSPACPRRSRSSPTAASRLMGSSRKSTLDPGELLIFDNQLVAHGRRGSRQPGELHQRVIGHRHAPPDQQRAIRDQFLTAFA